MAKSGSATLVSLLKWAADIALGAHVVVSAVVLGTLLLRIGSGEELASAWPISTATDHSVYEPSSQSESIANPAININEGSVSFASASAGYCFFKIVDTSAALLLTLLILVLLRRIVATLAASTPFSEDNAKRLRLMAFLIMGLSIHQLLQGFAYRACIRGNIAVEGAGFATSLFGPASNDNKTIWLDTGLDLQPLLTGALLLAIAEVFQVGVHLRRDSESIV